MIELKRVSMIFHPSKHGGVRALHNVDLSVAKGEIFGIIGASGAGKSTLLRCVNLLSVPTSGEVIVDGQYLTRLNPAELRAARRQIGMIFQHFNLLNTRTVYDNIAFPLEVAGLSKAEIEEKVTPIVHLTGLDSKLNDYPRQLSGGQKQRVAIARALVADTKVLLCDEATSSLDPETTKSILGLLEKVRSELNVTILLITHEIDVVKTICDRLAVIENGELIEQSGVGEFFTNPQSERAKYFVNSTLEKSLPAPLAEHLQHTIQPGFVPVLRLRFPPQTATESVLSDLVKKFDVDVTIVQATLEYVHHHAVGMMVLTLSGSHEVFDHCVEDLTARSVQVEILGYVPDDPASFEEAPCQK